MKKIFIFLIVAALISACSMSVNEFLGIPPTVTVVPTFFTNTATDVPTLTPTVPSPTFTVTPTMVGQKRKTSTPASTPTLLVIMQMPSTTPITFVTPPPPIKGFAKIAISEEQFYKGKVCLPGAVNFTVQVADASSVSFVVLFVRFKSKQSGATSEWTSIPMQPARVGEYTHDLVPLEMKSLDYFENAWVQYQIVSTDSNANQVARTDIFSERLTLLECVPTPTADSAVSATPTVLAP